MIHVETLIEIRLVKLATSSCAAIGVWVQSVHPRVLSRCRPAAAAPARPTERAPHRTVRVGQRLLILVGRRWGIQQGFQDLQNLSTSACTHSVKLKVLTVCRGLRSVDREVAHERNAESCRSASRVPYDYCGRVLAWRTYCLRYSCSCRFLAASVRWRELSGIDVLG